MSSKDLKLFYVFRLLATSYLWVPVFYFFMTSRGLGFDEIMMLAAVYSGVVILVEVPTGALADRIGRRESMMAGALAMVVSCIVAYFSHSFLSFLVAEVFAAISMSLCSGADSAYLYDLLEAHGREDEYARVEGKASAWHLAGNAAAFLVGGFLGEIDLALPYLATVGTAGLAFFVAIALRGEDHLARARVAPRPIGVELKSYMTLMRGALRDVLHSRRLIWIIFYSGVVFVLLRATHYLYQPYLKAIGFGIAETGMVFCGVYLVAAIVAHNVDKLRRAVGEASLVWGLLAALAVSFVLLNQFAGQWALCMLAIQAAAKGLFSPLVKPIINRQITCSSRRATVLSIESIARRAATGVFLPIIGFYGVSTAIYMCGVLGLCGMALLALMLRHSPATEADSDPAVDTVT